MGLYSACLDWLLDITTASSQLVWISILCISSLLLEWNMKQNKNKNIFQINSSPEVILKLSCIREGILFFPFSWSFPVLMHAVFVSKKGNLLKQNNHLVVLPWPAACGHDASGSTGHRSGCWAGHEDDITHQPHTQVSAATGHPPHAVLPPPPPAAGWLHRYTFPSLPLYEEGNSLVKVHLFVYLSFQVLVEYLPTKLGK